MPLERDAVVQVLLRERLRITGIAAAIVRDPHAADDVFQQVVLNALKPGVELADADHVLAWAVRTARHRALDAAHRRRLLPLPDETLDRLEAQWTRPEGWSDRAEALHRCLGHVAGPTREVLRLRYAEGLSAVVIAGRLHRTAEAVYQSLSRAHRALRDCVDRELARIDQPAQGRLS